MLVSLIRKLLRDHRAATAVAMAILLVPLVVTAGAAVDLARIAAVRTLLQASVDGAAVAGLSEWQMSETAPSAYSITNNEFSNTGAQLSNFASQVTATVNLACSPTATPAQCGWGAMASQTSYTGCSGGFEYCVVITATLTLKNSLLAAIIPSEFLSVTGGAESSFGNNGSGGAGASPGEHANSAGDQNAVYIGPVPPGSAVGSAGDVSSAYVSTPNGACSSAPGTIKDVPGTTGDGTTQCNYQFVEDSLQDVSTGSITYSSSQVLAFLFINDTGANGYNQIGGTHYTTHLMIATNTDSSGNPTDYQYYPGGESVTTPPTTCTYGQANCTPSTGGITPLYGQCPDHTLYGSIDFNYGAPQSDSLNTYSSAYEADGHPPTYGTNHVLTPFVTTNVVTQTYNGKKYYVEAVCPNYDTGGTEINAPVGTAYTSQTGNDPFTGMNTFSTWFPTGVVNSKFTAFQDDAASALITGGTVGGTTDIYPPAIAACAPAMNAEDGGVTPTSQDPWWDWGSSNIGNCTAQQTSNYSNCALLIQPLGTHVPVDNNNDALIPDYYNIIETPSGTILALDPVYDNMSYQDTLTGVTINNTDQAGYYPTNTTPTSRVITNITTIHGGGTATPYAHSAFVGDLLVVQAPASTGSVQDHNMPWMTSHKCYDPSVATKDGGYKPAGSSSDLLGYYPYTNNGVTIGVPYDPIANPQLGQVICDTNPPQTWALYWNDLGTYGSDDIGYWNALASFTCSVPSTSNQGAGAPTLF